MIFLVFFRRLSRLIYHQHNMSVLFIPPYTPLIYRKNGVYLFIYLFGLMGNNDFKYNKVPLFARKTGNNKTSMSAAPKLALVPG